MNPKLLLILLGALALVAGGVWLVSQMIPTASPLDSQVDLPATWSTSNIVPPDEAVNVTLFPNGKAEFANLNLEDGPCAHGDLTSVKTGTWDEVNGHIVLTLKTNDAVLEPDAGPLGSLDWSVLTTMTCAGKVVMISAF